jgi:hypothetical protein
MGYLAPESFSYGPQKTHFKILDSFSERELCCEFILKSLF